MGKFQVGDVVELLTNEIFDLKKGQMGQVVAQFNTNISTVSFFNWHNGHDGGHGEFRGVRDHSAAFIDDNKLKLVTREIDDVADIDCNDIL